MPESNSSPAPTSPSCPDRPGPLRRRCAGLHTLLHAAWSLLLVLLGIVIWLWVFGLPEPITRRVLERLSGDGFDVSVSRVQLDPTRGLELEGFVMNGPAPLGAGFLRADAVIVEVDWLAILRRREAWKGLQVRAGGLSWPYAAPSAATSHVWQTTGLDFDLVQHTQHLEIVVHRGESAGIRVKARGEVVRGRPGDARPFSWSWLSALASNSLAAPGWLESVRAETAALRQSEPPTLDLSFTVDPAQPAAARVGWQAAGARTFIRRGVLDGWSCAGLYRAGVLEITELELRSDRGTARARARWDTARSEIELDATSDLPAALALALLPPAGREGLQAQGVETVEGLHLELRVGSGPLTSWVHRLDGRITTSSMVWRTVPLRNVEAEFSVRPDGMRIHPLRALVGRGAGEGPVALSWQSGWSGNYAGELDLRFDPRHALPLLSPPLTALVSRFTFSNQPPQSVVRFTGVSGTNGHLAFDGHLTATQFTYRGVAVQDLYTGLRYTNSTLEMDRWALARPEGLLKGRLFLDLDADVQEVDMVSTLAPEALKQIIGPEFQQTLDFTRFSGPAVIGARGRYAGIGPGTQLQVDIEAEQASLLWFGLDRLTLQLGVEGETYRFSNIVARAYDGVVTGSFKLVFASNEPPRYAVNAGCQGVQLESLVKALRPDDTGQQQGRLAAQVQVRGLVGPGQGASAVGTGRVDVTDGQLSRIRLLGGLSSLLSAMAPGLGMAAQTGFHSDFVIRQGRCETQDAMLEGSVISIKVKGAYYFDERVKFVVEVKLLRGGAVASMVRWVTSPLTRLLAFKLTGTLADPQWRPINLPKEMFLIFD